MRRNLLRTIGAAALAVMVGAGQPATAASGGLSLVPGPQGVQELAAAAQKQPEQPAPTPPLRPTPGLEQAASAAEGYRQSVLAMKAGLGEANAETLEQVRREARWSDDWTSFIALSEKLIALTGESMDVWLAISDAAAQIEPDGAKTLHARWLAARLAPADKRAAVLAQLGDTLAGRRDAKAAAAYYRASLAWIDDSETRLKLGDMEQGRIRVTGATTDSENDPASVCFRFSGPLAEPGAVRYEDYVAVAPATDVAVYGEGESGLCVEGLGHGQHYDITLRQGLPGSDRKLLASHVQAVDVPDRSPRVGFKGNGLILPRTGVAGLPVVSVNLERARITVMRINDRNLIHNIDRGGDIGGWDIENIAEEDGELVWRGILDIQPRRNKQVTTALPLAEILGAPKPGLYVVIAERDIDYDRWDDRAAQWLVVSDIGLHVYGGADGLAVFARSFASGKPAPGTEVRLVARNNEVLATAAADAQGLVRFAPGLLRGAGGRAPKLLMAYGAEGDFSFLDLTQPAFDLTDRGVGGREAPGPLDAFLYTDRGIYRPGETAHLMVLLRDDKAVAVETVPLTLKLLRPDGVEVRRHTVTPGAGGAVALDLPFSDSDRTGAWTVNAYADPSGPPVGSVKLQIEDFVPSRMEVLLQVPDGHLAPGKPLEVGVEARFLYGAPAAGLAAEAELVLRRAETPFPDFAKYRFGLAQQGFEPTRIALAAEDTDADGRTRVTAALNTAPDTSHPLEAVLRAGVLEVSGRATTRSAVIPVRTRPLFVGLRPTFDGAYAPVGTEQGFEVIAVDAAGRRVAAPRLAWVLYEENVIYTWYRAGDRWTYRSAVRDQRRGGGTMAVSAEQPFALAQRLDWGRYRLEVRDMESGAASSLRFRVGWVSVASESGDTPDKMQVSSDKPAYRPGETARIHLSAPFAGEVLLTVARQGLVESRNVTLPAGGTIVELPVTEAWGTGVYVTATVFRPGQGPDSPGAGRAVGLAWVQVDPAPRTLQIAMEVPQEVRPNQTISLPVTVTGATGQAHVTLAAVDEGILMLTDFATPDPARHYYGKRRLAVEMRDSYGKLIDVAAEARGTVRSGGDAASRHAPGLQDKHIKPLSLFSGIVALDAQGRAVIPLELPEFNGRVRLMAVAFDADKVGHAEAPLLVRAPMVLQASLPRFLAPGDQGMVTLAFDNIAGAPGKWTLKLSGEGVVEASDGEAVLNLPQGGKLVHRARVTAHAIGSGKLVLALTGPDGTKMAHDWPISVRPLQAVTTEQWASVIEPGASEHVDGAALARFLAGSAEATVTLTTGPNFNLGALLKSLDRYPYGCVEQTTSRALPLLYLSDLAGAIGQGEKDAAAIRGRVQKAVDSVVARQSGDGGFSLWGGGDGEVWLSAYAIDFLQRARVQSYGVPDFALERGLRWLKQNALRADYDRADMASTVYAMHVLARGNMADPGALRYTHDALLSKVDTPVARVHLASALAQIGDRTRAESAFASIDWRQGVPYRHYGSWLRDAAAYIALGAESGAAPEKLFDLADEVARRMGPPERLSTQEKAWLTLAAHAMMQRQGEMAVEVDGVVRTSARQPLLLRPDADALATQGIALRNAGGVAVRRIVSVTGVPKAHLPPSANGMAVSRVFYTLDGEIADLSAVTQNDVLVAVIEVENNADEGEILVVDLLPAGFELENARLAHGRSTEGLTWLPELSTPEHMELRDDRFVAAFSMGHDTAVTTGYLVRAVTPGSYGLPAVLAEDMYRPEIHARDAVGAVTVAPRR